MSEHEQHVSMTKSHNRRSVVKGAAWSIPVIAAAVAAPAASASTALVPELVITNFTNAGNGGVPQWTGSNGEPGYWQDCPMVFHARVWNQASGPSAGPATSIYLDVNVRASSYKDGSAYINASSDAGWVVDSVFPWEGDTTIIRLVFTGSLEPGAETTVYLNAVTSDVVAPGVEHHIVSWAGIVASTPAESNTANNTTYGTPNYWIKHS